MNRFVASVAAMLIAAPAFAEPSGGAAAGTGAESAADSPQPAVSTPAGDAAGERRICRRIERSERRVGARRVCMTAREWGEFNRRD